MRSGYHIKSPFGLTALQSIIAILCLAAVMLCAFGCASGNPLTRPVVRETTIPVPTLVTNPVPAIVPQPPRIEYVTNLVAGAPLVITNIIERPPIVVTNQVVSLVTNFIPVLATNYVANPDLMAGIETARRANSALNPTPTSPFVDWGLTGLGAIATIVAGWQTRRANRAQQIGDTLIKSVESYPGSENKQIKAHIERVSELVGVSEMLAARVDVVAEEVTDAMGDGKMDAIEIWSLAKNPKISEADIPDKYRQAFRELRENILLAERAKAHA